MESTPINGVQDTYKLTLSSHPGKALILKDKVDHYGGHDVNWFTVGEESKALKVTLKYNKDGHCFIRYKRPDIRGGGKDGHAFDCSMNEYHEGNKVPGYNNHKGGNQRFVVNQDKTISPTLSPKMILGLKDDDLVLVKNSDFKNRLVFDKLEPSFNLETLKVMALKPSSHKGIGIVIKDEVQQHGHGMIQYLEIGDQSQAISIFIDQNDHMLWSEMPSLCFDAYQHEDGQRKYLFTSRGEDSDQQFTVNDNGTISVNDGPEYVLGISEDQKNVICVKKGSTNQFIFDNAKKILGLEEKYAHDAIKKAQEEEQRKKLKEPFKLKNGIELRYSQEIGGDKSTNHEIFEWPSNEYLNNLSQEQLENFSISSIQWVKGTHFGPQEDFCNSLMFQSNHGEQSPLFAEKVPNEKIDVSKIRIAKICGKTNYHHAFCYKLFDDFGKVIKKPIYSKYDEKKEDETTIEIGLDEKLVGFRIQLSDWVDCKISKIWFKIAKCKQQGINYDEIEKHVKEIEAQKKKLQKASLKLLQGSNLASSYQVWYIEKHTGEKFIQHCNADGTYIAYRQGTDDVVDSGDWKVEGTTYMEKGGDWKGEITMKGEKNFFVDFYAREHGYHKYTGVFEPYEKGWSKDQLETIKNDLKLAEGGQWFCIHYSDFCYGDTKSESCTSYDQAVKILMTKPKVSNVAYQYWVGHKKLFTKPTGKGATWTNEHTNNNPNDGNLFLYGKNTGVKHNGRTLFWVDGVDAANAGAADGRIDYNVTSYNEALEKVKKYKNTNVSHQWHSPSQRLIEQPPNKRCGKWDSGPAGTFMWADKIIDKVLGDGEKFSLQDVANDPKSFILQLSGHNDHPSCNGEYSYSGEKHAGKYKWTHSSGETELVWTGRTWDIGWGGYSPEAPVDTPMPPESGYTIDQGGCDIKVQYRRVSRMTVANGEKLLYQRIKLTQFDQVFGIVCAQEWEDSQGQTFSFQKNGKLSFEQKPILPAGSDAILPAGSDAIGPANDGWGPYKCILAVRDNGKELIAGKLATSKNQAFFSYGGREHPTKDYKIVTGTIMAKGDKPNESDAVGFQTHCIGAMTTQWYGKHYIGITDGKANDGNCNPGKVKDGTLYYGYGGSEYSTQDFHYVKVSHIDGEPAGSGALKDSYKQTSLVTELTWILNPESKILINTQDGSDEYELVWKKGVMALETQDQEKKLTLRTSQNPES